MLNGMFLKYSVFVNTSSDFFLEFFKRDVLQIWQSYQLVWDKCSFIHYSVIGNVFIFFYGSFGLIQPVAKKSGCVCAFFVIECVSIDIVEFTVGTLIIKSKDIDIFVIQ